MNERTRNLSVKNSDAPPKSKKEIKSALRWLREIQYQFGYKDAKTAMAHPPVGGKKPGQKTPKNTMKDGGK